MRAILFDLDETLLDRTPALVAFLADQHARFRGRLGDASPAAWRDRFLALDARGRVPKSDVYPALLDALGGDPAAADALVADYRERCCRFARAVPGMEGTLAVLRRRGFRLGIVTNGETAFQDRHLDALGLGDRVDAILISEAEGLRKPDARLFHRAAARLGVAPALCLFVGDDPAADIVGAAAAGMRTAWLRRGAAWPDDLPAPPGAVVDALPEVLRLAGPAPRGAAVDAAN